MKILLVIDMQNDFVDGSLGTKEAINIIPNVIDKIKNFNGLILATRDTHYTNYLETLEGKNLPITHCIHNTKGWEVLSDIEKIFNGKVFDKSTFGSTELAEYIKILFEKENIESITLVGLCTDICVISNAILLKAFFPNIPIIVDSSCCAGVTPESHLQALEAMKMCQITIE